MTQPRRRPVLEQSRRRSRRPGRSLLAIAAVAAAAGAVAAVLATTGGLADDVPVPPRPTEGTTTREIYSRVRPGASRDAVIALAGSPPARTHTIVRSGVSLDCIVYLRRSGRPGHYRFCFRGGSLWTKSAPALGFAPADR